VQSNISIREGAGPLAMSLGPVKLDAESYTALHF